MSTRTLAHITIAIVSAGSSPWAATRIVGKPNTPCPGAQYTTITAAVKAASAGDTVEVCPAVYPEQVLIEKGLTLVGREVNDVDRVLVQPTSMTAQDGAATEAVITVLNSRGPVIIRNFAVDASNNGVSGCSIPVAGIYYFNSSGAVDHNAIFGAMVNNPQNCPLPQLLLYGSGFGVQVDSDAQGPFQLAVTHNSIHDFTRNGVLATSAAVTADIEDNTITGMGPAVGVFQFGVFLSSGAIGTVRHNVITEGLCGSEP